jgi:hypothetical protein
MQRLLFDLPKQLGPNIAAQQLSCMQDNESRATISEHTSGMELAHGDLMEELNAIVRKTSHIQK